MSAIVFFGGMIMVMLGMIGEYIGRIYISMNNSPQYVIREQWNLNGGTKKED
jgi:undecaprenyl-phosphate 4-deoxy-4-formamido-L-arabinose transferase